MTPKQQERASRLLKQAAERFGGQQALAEAIGMDRSNISMWITGRQRVSPKALGPLYRAAGLMPSDLRPDLAELFRVDRPETPEHV